MFENGSEVVRVDFHLHTRKDREFKYSGEDFGLEMRVDIRRSLVIRVAKYFHGDQRFHACLEKQRRVIVPEIVRRERRFQLLDDVVLTLGCLGHFALFYAIGSLHQAEPDTLEAALRPRLAFLRMEYILLREAAHLRQHSTQLLRGRNGPLSLASFL